jgi:hypothetical protein
MLVFAQSNRTESVALVPFWGADENFIQEFGEVLFEGVNDMQGYRSVVIDMTDLPEDVPEGGFPPYICPSPSLIKTNPIALTGELTPDPDDDEFWHLRLYLWEMADTRLIFSDELTAYDRDECAAAMPGMLEWLFSWLKRARAGSGSGTEMDVNMSDLYGQGRQVFITTSMPLQWVYAGVRFGWTPSRIQSALTDNDRISYYDTINAALSASLAVAPESVPFFCRFMVQVDGILNYDFQPKLPNSTMSINPTALLKFQAYRRGNLLFCLLGGAYTSFHLDNITEYETKFPVGWTAGATFGGKLDPAPGVFFIDVRFSMDLFNTRIQPSQDGFKRKSLTISLGYEYGFITKK